jgi:hypothetical protein
MTLSSVTAGFLGVSFTFDGAEHPVNNHTKTIAAKQVKYLVDIIVGFGLPPEISSQCFGKADMV